MENRFPNKIDTNYSEVGFVPESLDDQLPFQLVRDSTNTEESYILKAESSTSHKNPIFFEGTMNKSAPVSGSSELIPSSNEFILLYDSVAKSFKLQKFNGMIRMSKSRNEATLASKLNKLAKLNKDKINEYTQLLQKFSEQRQLSISKVRNEQQPIVPQQIPKLPKKKLPSPPILTKVTKSSTQLNNKKKISTTSIRKSLQKQLRQQKSSPLVQGYTIKGENTPEIDDLDLNKPKVAQPKPISSAIASKRLPLSSEASTPVLSQLKTSKSDSDSDSDLGSLAFELEAELDTTKSDGKKRKDSKASVTTTKENFKSDSAENAVTVVGGDDDDDWRINNLDWDLDEDDFNTFDDLLEEEGGKIDILVQEAPSSQQKEKSLNIPKNLTINGRELTPTGPISMKELASLRSGNTTLRESSPALAPTPVMSSSSKPTFPHNKSLSNDTSISSIPTPRLSDNSFVQGSSKGGAYEDDEDISEEE